MFNLLDADLIALAERCALPIYLVGGFVRNFLIDGSASQDYDLASALDTQSFLKALSEFKPNSIAEYKNTGTVTFTLGKNRYEYTQFRKETYARGNHKPQSVQFVSDIVTDAKRRDFKCNAVYYDIKNKIFVDPLGGIADIKAKILDTVAEPSIVFACDGLRLMRLARFYGQLCFTPTEQVLDGAKAFANNIDDISKERILEELKLILTADTKYPFSLINAPSKCLTLLKEIGVLERIFDKELTNLQVLDGVQEQYRLHALLLLTNESSLEKLKVDTKTKESVKRLNKASKKALNLANSNKIREFLLEFYAELPQFFALSDLFDGVDMQTIKAEYDLAIKQGAPFNLIDLKIQAKTLQNIGFSGKELGSQLKKLQFECVLEPSKNNQNYLLETCKKDILLLKNSD